jgi:hypothetical protein
MEENLETLVPKDKPSTRKTARLTRAQRLEIVEDSLLAYQYDSGEVKIMPEFYDHGRRAVVVLLYDVMIDDNHLVPISAQPE